MLPKINRIKKKKDFDLIFKNGEGFRNNFLFLKILKNKSNQKRFGFVVSQKISKKSVIRNKIRRRMSETIRKEQNNIKNNIDVVFISLSGIEKKNFSETKEVIYNLLEKAKILINKNV